VAASVNTLWRENRVFSNADGTGGGGGDGEYFQQTQKGGKRKSPERNRAKDDEGKNKNQLRKDLTTWGRKIYYPNERTFLFEKKKQREVGGENHSEDQ